MLRLDRDGKLGPALIICLYIYGIRKYGVYASSTKLKLLW